MAEYLRSAFSKWSFEIMDGIACSSTEIFSHGCDLLNSSFLCVEFWMEKVVTTGMGTLVCVHGASMGGEKYSSCGLVVFDCEIISLLLLLVVGLLPTACFAA